MLTIPDGTRGAGSTDTGKLGYREAKESPCLSCPTSPCCSYLPLNKFRVTTLVELDHAAYLSNFDRVELGLSASGEWSAHYRFPCRFLARGDFHCTVHGSSEQPHICARYNPFQCWYRSALTSDLGDEFLRIDPRRMDFILGQVVFGEDRKVVEVPSWEALAEAFGEIPVDDNWHFPPGEALSGPAGSPAPSQGADGSGQAQYGYQDAALRDACAGCGAYCCTTLVFPQGVPTTAANLDYFRFSLGFPGIELGISDGAWTMALHARCRHLSGNRCSIYGRPERPIICSYYDEWNCSYRRQYGRQPDEGFLRVRLEQFDALAGAFRFDENGDILEMPPVESLAARCEERGPAPAATPSPSA